jgi:formylglycine-generating enzyme required for sulfatase activity
MRRALRLAAFSACVGAAFLVGAEGCALFVELDDLSNGDNNNAPDDERVDGGGADASSTTGDASVRRDDDVVVEAPYEPPPPPDGGCTSLGGPQPVRIKGANVSFCVDTTEVTRAQYAAFLATDPKLADLLPPQVCAWKTGFVPAAPWPPSTTEEADLPATNIDWCDAMAFCTWSGKHLCGKIGGGAVSNPRDTNVSEFLNACSKGGTRSYPYGNTYEPQSCNGVDLAANRLLKAGSLPKCVIDGVFDMSGNAHELVNSCSPAPDAGPVNEDNCEMHQGAYDGHSENDMKCATFSGWRRDRKHPAVGFRCCGN